MATPRGITQPHTSFIGSACQGIHHTPVTKHTDTQSAHKTLKHKKERKIMLASTIQFSHNTTPHKHTTTTAAAHPRQGHNQEHTHSCCPRHPTVHQHKPPFATQPGHFTHHTHTHHVHAHPGVCSLSTPHTMRQVRIHSGFLKTNTGGSHTLGDINHHTHNCGQP